MLSRSILLSVLLTTVVSFDEKKEGYGGSSHSKYGVVDQHKNGHQHEAEHADFNKKHVGYESTAKDAGHAATDANGAKKNDESHAAQHQGGSKYADEHSNFGKDVKSKSFGFFDYQYVQPQYHVEQFHTDEKHGSKYGADSHNYGTQEHGDSHYDDQGNNKYGKGYVDHGAHNSKYEDGKFGHEANHADYNKGYGDVAEGHYNHGDSGYERDFGRKMHTPSYYGYAPIYGHY